METENINICKDSLTGFFTIEVQTRKTRLAWILSIPISFCILIIGIWEAIESRGSSHVPEAMEIILGILFFFILPVAFVLVGITKMFQRPGVYLKGIKTTDSGFEDCELIVDLSSIEPQDAWRKTCSGKIIKANLNAKKSITDNSLQVVVFLKEDREMLKHYFFERFVIASKESVLYQLIGFNNLIAVLNGSFQLLGGKHAVKYENLIPSLEFAADVLSTARPVNSPTCTLNLVAKTFSFAAMLPFGMVGAIVAAGVDALHIKKISEKFKSGKLFDDIFTEKLMDFLNRRRWMITVSGEEIERES